MVTVPCSNESKPRMFLVGRTLPAIRRFSRITIYTHWLRFHLKYRYNLAVFRSPGLSSALMKYMFWKSRSTLVFIGMRSDFVSVGRCLAFRRIEAKHRLCRQRPDPSLQRVYSFDLALR